MIDIGWPHLSRARSTLDRLPTGFSDFDANDLRRLAASLDGLTLRCREPGADKTSQHSHSESIGAQQRFGKAAPIHRDQL
jgi:hypothetical protein